MGLDARSTDLAMSDAEFRLFAELLSEHCGLHFCQDTRYLLEKRISRRIHQLGLGSFSAYHYLLRNDAARDEELAQLIDEVTTNETYFLREPRQLRALMQEILPELLSNRGERTTPISLWSAGCSSGEEPYSIVLLALEAGLSPGRDLRVYGSDISRRMLQKARRGVYRPASFREMPERLRDKYFIEKDGLFRIADEVKRHVCFAHLNLLDRSRIAVLGSMDVVLCRNVIIYFGMETKRRVISTFEEKLRPGGYLLLGHSESLINLSNAFELRHLRHDLVYRKPAVGELAHDPWHAAAAAALEQVDGDGGGP